MPIARELLVTCRPVASDEDVERLRQLRNVCSGLFSEFNGYISEDDQRQWWARNSNQVEVWLYVEWPDFHLVGFGMARLVDGYWWNSIGVHPDARGKRLGSFITHDVLIRHGGQMYAAVRRDNPAALAMHHTDEWEEIDGPERERLVYLRSRIG